MKPPHTSAILAAATVLAFPISLLAAEARPTVHPTTVSSSAPAPELGNNTKHIKAQEAEQRSRRRAAYDTWFYRKNGQHPTEEQFRDWHYRAFGVYPS